MQFGTFRAKSCEHIKKSWLKAKLTTLVSKDWVDLFNHNISYFIVSIVETHNKHRAGEKSQIVKPE